MTTDITWDEFAAELFADEYCAECLGDAGDHEPQIVLGNWFAHCKQPLAPGVIVESQGEARQRGHVLNLRHPLDGWVWVQWDVTGRWDEDIVDLTIIGRPE